MKNSIYWPGTNIPKSNGNAFDWKSSASRVTQDLKWRQPAHSTSVQKQRQFTIYSRAKPADAHGKAA